MSCFKDCLKPRTRVATETYKPRGEIIAARLAQTRGRAKGTIMPFEEETLAEPPPEPRRFKSIIEKPKPITTVKIRNLDEPFSKIGMETGGLVDTANVIVDWWIGSNIPIKVQNFLKKNGNLPVETLQVGRSPISNTINTALNVISAGQFDKVKAKLGYDVFFHLYLIINNKFILEKNEVFNVKPYKAQKGEEKVDVVLDKNITIGDLLEVASVDKNNFYGNYDPFTNNCQDAVMTLLQKNGLINASLTSFIKQDVSSLLSDLQPLKKQAKQITNVGALINKLLQYATGGQRSFARGSTDLVRMADANCVRVRQH
jgi:hypothetical protein